MQLGMPLAEYEHTVGPKNKRFHELAEAHYLARDGIINPGDDDDSDAMSQGVTDDPFTDSEASTGQTKVRQSIDNTRQDSS